MLGIIGLIIAVAAVIFMIWKNWHMAVVSLVGALIVIVFNGMNAMTALTDNFMTGMASFAGNWFLLFMLGSIFGKVMGDSGASVGIANHLLKLLGEKSVVLVVMLTGLVLRTVVSVRSSSLSRFIRLPWRCSRRPTFRKS